MTFDTRGYNFKLMKEIRSQDNVWYTKENYHLGRDPTDLELVTNYVETGGVDRFRQKHEKEFYR